VLSLRGWKEIGKYFIPEFTRVFSLLRLFALAFRNNNTPCGYYASAFVSQINICGISLAAYFEQIYEKKARF